MDKEIKERIDDINSGVIPEGYKKTKVGIVPAEWERFKLSDISEELTEKAGDNVYETLSISAGIGFVNQADKFGKELSGKQYEKYIVLHKGDFSYNKGNSKKYPQGCIYQLKDREAAAVPNVFESFRLTKGINDYYEQLFVSGFMNSQLFAKINHGVRDDGLLNLKGDDFYSCYVPFPPLPEQQKIAEILSTQDKLIGLQEKKIEKLKELKKAYLQKMFPKKGSKYPELRFKGFTDAWEQRKLSEIVKSIDTGKSKFHSESNNGEYAILGSTSIIGYDNCYDYEGDFILTARVGANAGSLYRYTGKAKISDNTVFIQAEKNIEFVYYMLTKFDIKQLSFGTGQPLVKASELKNLDLKMPTQIEEQQKIGAYFSQLDNLITLHQRKSEQEKQKKKALMQLLLTGIVRTK